VLDPCKRLQKEGFDVTFLEPPADGIITADMIKAAIREDTILVSIMWANNEIGTINEIPQIGAALPRPQRDLPHRRHAVGRQDAHQRRRRQHRSDELVQPQDLWTQGRRRALRAAPQAPRSPQAILDGGGQERGFRSGTLNVTGIVGFGKACEIAQKEMEGDACALARAAPSGSRREHHQPSGGVQGQWPRRQATCLTSPTSPSALSRARA
jgi:cysteine desulfurase